MYVIDEAREEKEIQAKYEELLAACRQNSPLTQKQEDEIFRAFSLAKKAHSGTRRKSGEPYIFHPLAVALIAVQEVGLGPIAVVCALLHDVVEDTDITLDQIRTIFGDRVAVIVDGVTKIEDVLIMQSTESKQAENYRKILLSMCNDAYVIFLKLCDRLHNMRTLDSMKDTKKLAISSETQYLYIPLAHRLGLYSIKTELEELVMKYTNPEKYNEIAALINKTAGTEDRLKECFTQPVTRMLDANGYKYTIKTRIKSVYSCWKKMERKGVKFDEIYDLYAMRIILDVPLDAEKSECFKVYSLISSAFPPDPTRFRDWITTPKTNGYESLQTTVMTPIGQWVESAWTSSPRKAWPPTSSTKRRTRRKTSKTAPSRYGSNRYAAPSRIPKRAPSTLSRNSKTPSTSRRYTSSPPRGKWSSCPLTPPSSTSPSPSTPTSDSIAWAPKSTAKSSPSAMSCVQESRCRFSPAAKPIPPMNGSAW